MYHKTLCNCHFFLLLIPSTLFGWTAKSLLSKFPQLLLQTCLAKIGSPSLGTLENYCEFCMCENGMPCGLEINSNDGSKRGHVESSTATSWFHYYNAYGQ